MTSRIWLGRAENVSVPVGPTRNAQQLSGDLKNYHSIPSDDGTMLDGNPFTLFFAEGDGEPQLTLLDPSQTAVTVGGREFSLRWVQHPTEVGLLLLVGGLLNNCGCDGCFTAVTDGDEGPFAFAYCLAWNNMGVSVGGKLHRYVCEWFGLPMTMAYPPAPKKDEAQEEAKPDAPQPTDPPA